MALISPGVQVSVIDESFYTPAEPGTRPLFIVASAQDKLNGAGTGTAQGTLAANAGKVYLITSQRDLVDTFGDPMFKVDSNNNPIHAGEQNEYGLQAAYSYLGVSNSAFVVRANLDLDLLTAQADAPGGAPQDGTFWLDTGTTAFGIFQWNGSPATSVGGQSFASKAPVVILDESKYDSGGPLSTVGAIGEYAVVQGADQSGNTPDDRNNHVLSLYYKSRFTEDGTNNGATWVKVGSNGWIAAWPTVQGSGASAITPEQTLIINGTTVTASPGTTTVTLLAEDINDANIENVSARVVDGLLQLYVTNGATDSIVVANGTGSIVGTGSAGTSGLRAGTYYTPKLTISKHTEVPAYKSRDDEPRPTGSVWIKTTEPNAGARWRLKQYNGNTQLWTSVESPLYPSSAAALAEIAPSTGGVDIPVNTAYTQFNFTGLVTDTLPLADFRVLRRARTGATTINSKAITADTLTASDYTFTLAETRAGSPTLNAKVIDVTVTGEVTDAAALEGAINNAGFTNLIASVDASNKLVIQHALGGEIQISEDLDTDTGVATLVLGSNHGQGYTPGNIVTVAGGTASTAATATILTTRVKTVTISSTLGAGGTGYSVNDIVEIGGGTGTKATIRVTSVDTGVVTGVTLVTSGSYTANPTLADNLSNGEFGTGLLLNLVMEVDTLTLTEPGLYTERPTTLTNNVVTGGSGTGLTVNITFTDVLGTLISQLGLVTENENIVYNAASEDNTYSYVASNWVPLTITPDTSTRILQSYYISANAPETLPADGTLWYSSVIDEVDIMIHNGTTWVGYQNFNTAYTQTNPAGPIVSASQPLTQSDGSALVDGDLWIDTSDIENYPLIKRYNYDFARWDITDKTDQTSENGVLFADARYGTSGGSTNVAPAGTIEALLTSNYVDPDCPDPVLYPRGMLLWNLRRSGFNVKKFVRNAIDITADNERMPGNPSMGSYYPHRWVTESGNQNDGSGSFGRKAQRKVVIQALQALINSNQDIRDTEVRNFNLIAAPGYPELIGEMITLNNDRGLTAFVIGDSPARLTPDSTTINDWGYNVAGSLQDDDNGLVSFDEYTGVFYPWGFTSDNAGRDIAVPPSHMICRMIALSDQVSYPWFAPAGTRRGGITNASNVGYVSSEGEFVAVSLNEGQRDTLYNVKVNPITYFTGAGLVNFGQKTRAKSASALDRINVARLVIYLRRQLSVLAKPYIFEPNDKITRDEIKQQVESLLLELVGQRALYDFLVVCDESNNTPNRIDRNELYVDIAIEPVKAVEFIYIPIRLKNTGEIAGLGQ